MTTPYTPGVDGPELPKLTPAMKALKQASADFSQASMMVAHEHMHQQKKIDTLDKENAKLQAKVISENARVRKLKDKRNTPLMPEELLEMFTRTGNERDHWKKLCLEHVVSIEQLKAALENINQIPSPREIELSNQANDRMANVCKLASAAIYHINDMTDNKHALSAVDLLKPLSTGVHDTERHDEGGMTAFAGKYLSVLNNDNYDPSMGDDPHNEWGTWPEWVKRSPIGPKSPIVEKAMQRIKHQHVLDNLDALADAADRLRKKVMDQLEKEDDKD